MYFYTFVIRELSNIESYFTNVERTFFDTFEEKVYETPESFEKIYFLEKLFPDFQPNNIIDSCKYVFKHHESGEIKIVELIEFKEITEDEYKVLSKHLTYWKQKYDEFIHFSSLKP